MWVRILLKWSLLSLKIIAGKLSHPTAQFFKLSMILLISDSVVGVRKRLTVYGLVVFLGFF